MHKEFKMTPDEEMKRYGLHNNTLDDPRYVSYLEKFIKNAVMPYRNGKKSALDFGSGPEAALAEILIKKYDLSVDVFDIYFANDQGFKKRKYDIIVCTEVIEHIEEPLETFKLFYDLLNKDGILAVMTHFHKNDDEHFLKWHYIRDRTHTSFFSLKTLEVVSKQANLHVLFTDGVKMITFVRK